MIRSANMRATLRRMRSDRSGAALIEFALLAPVLITLLIGVLQVGMYMQNYSAVRSLAADAARFAAVEYQKSNNMPAADLEANIRSIAVDTPYNLRAAFLTVDIEEVVSPVDGARKFDMDISYTSPGFLSGLGLGDVTLTHSRPLFVVDNGPI